MQSQLTILVPQGAEYRAVRQGLLKGGASSVAVMALPIGPTAGERFLHQWRTNWNLAPARVLVMGLCGGLRPHLSIGAAVLYHRCEQGYGAGAAHQLGLACDRTFTEQLHQWLPAAQPVTGITCDRVIHLAQAKQHLAQARAVDVVDMEGFPILTALTAAGIPGAMLRVVSDGDDYDIPDLTCAIDAAGNLQPVPTAAALLRQPLAALHLMQGALKGLAQLQHLSTQLAQGLKSSHAKPDSSRQ